MRVNLPTKPSPSADPPRERRPARKPRHVQRAKLALDVTLLAVALGAARVSGAAGNAELTPIGWVAAFAALVIFNLAVAGEYRPRFTLHFLDEARAILGATAIAAMTISFVRLLGADDSQIANQAARLWLFSAAYLVAGRGAYGLIRARARKLGVGGDATLIIGAGHVGHSIARRLLGRPEFGLRPVAFLDDDPLPVEDPVALPVVRGDSGALVERLAETIDERGIEHVVLAFSLAGHGEELALVRCCTEMGASVSLVPRLFEGVPDQTRLERIGGIPLITVYPNDPRAWQFRIKYALDRLVAAFVLVLVSPVLAIALAGTLITIGRPLFFRQVRVGLDNREFEILKVRTMRDAAGGRDAELEQDLERGLAPGGVEGGDRRSAFGALLRRTSIDELPQLLNVLRGEMSLIGPRPERPEFAGRFAQHVHRYGDRHRVKSGITGWAQVHGLRGRTSLADRVEWDNYYIENWSPWLDVKIVLLTIRALLGRGGA